MAAVSGLPSHPLESRLMLSEYLPLPQSHPYFPLNNIHLDVDVKPDRVATFILCTQLPLPKLRAVSVSVSVSVSVCPQARSAAVRAD
eukprot:COSAG03_NODE_446_length_7847_cov_4.635777_4_plen_87_part_00